MESVPKTLNWVKARAECSIGYLFETLVQVIDSDVKTIRSYDSERRHVFQFNRVNEWKVFVVVWILVALLHAGFFAFGTVGAQWLQPGMIGPEIVTFITHMNVFAVKVLIGSWIFIWARWTLPRFRYDQLMNLGWKYMLPVAALNVLIAGAWIAVTSGAQ